MSGGPGNATRDLSIHFEKVVACDPSASMIATARELGGRTKNGEPIIFQVREAERCDTLDGIPPGSVDLITAAMAVGSYKKIDGSVLMIRSQGTLVRYA